MIGGDKNEIKKEDGAKQVQEAHRKQPII